MALPRQSQLDLLGPLQIKRRVLKRVYPISSNPITSNSSLRHWAMVLKPVHTAFEEDILIELEPCGVTMSLCGQSSNDASLAAEQVPENSDLGITSKSTDDIKLWIFSNFKIVRNDSFSGFGEQLDDYIDGPGLHDMATLNCREFCIMLADYLETPIPILRVCKVVYPVAETSLGAEHWAILLKPCDIVIEYAPCGVIINRVGVSVHHVFLEPGQSPECTELGITSRSLAEIKLWIFNKFKVLRSEGVDYGSVRLGTHEEFSFDEFGKQPDDVLEHHLVSMNCQDFCIMLAEECETPIHIHTQASEIVGGVAAVAGIALAGFSAPFVLGGAAVLAVASSTGHFGEVTESSGIAALGDGVSRVAGGVDSMLGGAVSFGLTKSVLAVISGARSIASATTSAETEEDQERAAWSGSQMSNAVEPLPPDHSPSFTGTTVETVEASSCPRLV